jgi:DNA-binding response OmpR family regulator
MEILPLMNTQPGVPAMVAAPTILVIDDDPDIRADLRMILEDQGYRVITAPDGQSGLKLALTERLDLIICDMMMPKMSGFIVLERVKQNEQKSIPFIMLTANDSDHQRDFAEFLGVDAYLNKPIGTKPLLEQLQAFCRKPAATDHTAVPCSMDSTV